MDHTGKASARIHVSARHPDTGNRSSGDSHTAMAWSIPGTQERRIPHARGVEHTGASAEPLRMPPRHPAHGERSSEDLRGHTPCCMRAGRQRRTTRTRGVPHTGTPAAGIRTSARPGSCRQRQLRQWHWCRLWMWSALPVSSSPVPAARRWPLPHRGGVSPWSCAVATQGKATQTDRHTGVAKASAKLLARSLN